MEIQAKRVFTSGEFLSSPKNAPQSNNQCQGSLRSSHVMSIIVAASAIIYHLDCNLQILTLIPLVKKSMMLPSQ